MVKSIGKRFLSVMLVLVLLLTLLPVIQMPASAVNVNTGVTGLTADSSGNATWNLSGGTLTGSVQASASEGCTGTTYTAQTGTLTFTNSSGATALLSFDYSLALSGGSATIDGANAEGGSFSKALNAGDTVAVAITSPKGEGTANMVISNLKLTPEADVDITFKAPTNGSYTVDGAAVSADTVKTVKTTGSVALAATAASGYKFFGWYSSAANGYVAFTASATLSFTESTTVEPRFVPNGEPVFQVGAMAFTDLNEAVGYAQSSGIAKIVLISNGTLPAGNYTIPNGKTLLIPMDAAYTMVKATPTVLYDSYATPSAFRVLTMASGANITVQSGGAISLASNLSSKGQLGGYNGTPTGPDGRINMASGSSITVQNGGNLYAWGYIYGSGAVTAESGATVYEAFQIKDWRGGTATSNVYSYAFIMNQYYVQNIEVPLTLYAGATEKLYSSVNASSSAHTMGATFVGSGGMFNITSGYIVKDYIESSDRLQVDAYGSVSITPMRLTGLPIIGSISTDSYVLPITSNITINIHDGVTANITQDIELLPSAEINVDSGATMEIADGKRVYVYDNDDWGNFTGSARLYVIGYSVANGTAAKRTAAGLTDAKINVNGVLNVKGSLYTSAGGAAIVSDGGGKVVLTKAPTATSTINEMENNKTKVDVTFTAAKLQNADGTYYETAGKPAGTEVPYANGKWGGTAQTYTVTWKNEDGTVLETDENVAEGTTPTYDGETPTKAGDAQYSYTFKEWSPAITAVTGDVTYTATYTQTTNTYTVKWLDADGEILETDASVPYGTMPEYNGATPTKEATASATYSFSGWDPVIAPVTGDVSYTAQFTEAARTYTVTWKDDDGNVLETDTVAYGEMPVYNNGQNPVKAADQQYTYTFKAWSPEVVAVSGDATYTATYDKTVNKYTVTWLAEDGKTVLGTAEVEYGTKPVYNNGVDPVKDDTAQFDYEFAGWVNGSNTYATADLPVVTDDVAYKASFSETLRTYTVTWVNGDGSVLETDENVPYGSDPSYDGATPAKEATAQYSYTFAGWTPEVADVTGDVTYKATYTETTNTYTVIWKNADGSVLETDENVPYGTVPTYDGETPAKAGDAQYAYSFAGWDPTVAAVAGDVTYTAQFTEVTNTYTVYWVNDDGTQLEVDEDVAYGVTPEYNGETPTKAATAEFTYTFDSWTPAVSTVTGTITYTAVYTAVRNVYNITFVNFDGTVLDTQPVPYGDTPVYAGETPTKAATAEFTYTFSGWTPEIAAVTGEATYTATFSAEKNSYTVQFVNEDGTVLDTQTVAYGETPAYGGTAMPTKAATAEFTYTFSGWTPEIAAVTGDTTYTATFAAEKNSYAVKFVNEDGTVLDEQQVPYGEVPDFGGETPAKAETARWSYAFSGWTPALAAVTGDTTYTAKFDATGKNGLCVEGEDTYWIENGENVPFPGLIRIVLDDGTVNYYYFGEDGKAVKDGTFKVEKNNGERLPAYNYNFGPDGVIEHDKDTSKNGVCEGDGSVFYYIDGVKVGEGLIFIDGSYYYARTSTAEIVRDRTYYVSKTNGLPIAPGEYRFDADGKLMLNGFVEQDGKTYYYDNGTRLYGFNKIGEDYYFFNAANGSMYRSMKLWVGENTYGVEPGYYDFGADGKMVIAAKDGLVTEGGATYGYDNGTKLYGFQKIGDDYYFFNKSSGKMYTDAKLWVGENAYGVEPGYYDFGADGRMIVPGAKNGFVQENGATYYYVDGEPAKGLTKIGEDYYFFNLSSGKLYTDRNLWVGANDYGFEGGMYYFDADGKMVP